MHERCRACGLDYRPFAGNARVEALFSFLIAFAVGAAAILVEREARPPLPVHLLWFPVTLAAIAGGLRLAKAASVAFSYDEAGAG